MLGVWLSVAQVVISGYQPIAEQTWVQLNPEYYPLARTPPAMFVAWRGNQFPPLAQKQKNGRWQILFPARLVPPFDLFEGEAQLSKTYLARLRRIDEMAYGVASVQAVAAVPQQSLSPLDENGPLAPFIAEFSAPHPMPVQLAVTPRYAAEPLLAMLGSVARAAGSNGELQLAAGSSTDSTTLTLSAPAAGSGREVCHQVAPGETLWRIANQLSSRVGGDTYSYLLALVAENQARLGHSIRVKTGDGLYCPRAETLAQFDALSPAQRQQQFARLEQGR
ncbi:LysM peptidoglycan-binding domain-containing protein [Aeromonas sp. 164P]